jgi:hypothetical protein
MCALAASSFDRIGAVGAEGVTYGNVSAGASGKRPVLPRRRSCSPGHALDVRGNGCVVWLAGCCGPRYAVGVRTDLHGLWSRAGPVFWRSAPAARAGHGPDRQRRQKPGRARSVPAARAVVRPDRHRRREPCTARSAPAARESPQDPLTVQLRRAGLEIVTVPDAPCETARVRGARTHRYCVAVASAAIWTPRLPVEAMHRSVARALFDFYLPAWRAIMS